MGKTSFSFLKSYSLKLHLWFGTQLCRGGGRRVERREGVGVKESTDEFCFVIIALNPVTLEPN